METLERLRRDHALLRAKLTLVENVLRMGPEAWLALREMSFSLLRQLQDHVAREDALVQRCRCRLDPKVQAPVEAEHEQEPAALQALNDRLLAPVEGDFPKLAAGLTEVIGRLRRHMDVEEATLFPLLEQELAAAPAASGAPGPLEATTTVNRAVRQFPSTRPVLERLFVNVPLEGCECLDEVAWRHGMEYHELAEALTAALEPSATQPERSPA